MPARESLYMFVSVCFVCVCRVDLIFGFAMVVPSVDASDAELV